MSVSGLILPKAVFDLHVSVSCLFGPKDADHLSDHVHGKILGTMSVSGCQVLFRKTPNLPIPPHPASAPSRSLAKRAKGGGGKREGEGGEERGLA